MKSNKQIIIVQFKINIYAETKRNASEKKDQQLSYDCDTCLVYRPSLIIHYHRNHNLKVITGRWHKPIPIPFHERKCDICNVLDDEFHFVFQCSKYDNERSTHINKYYTVRPSMFKFIKLLNSTDRKVIIDFCKYLKNTIMS